MLTLEEWLKERRDNCVRIANMKIGLERVGWLEDAAYFEAALERLNEAEPIGEFNRRAQG